MAKKVKWQGFVSVTLNQQEKKQIKEMNVSDGQALEFFTHAAELGYKVSVTFHDEKEFYTLTLYGNHPDNPNAGYAMTMRHRDLLVAIAAYYHVFEESGMGESWSERFDIDNENDW